MDELIKIHNPDFSEKEIANLQRVINNQKTNSLIPIFNLKGFIFGFIYLFYKKAYLEGLAVLIISLLLIQIAFILHSFLFLLLGIIAPNIITGWFFYFMYANKFDRDLDECGKNNFECLKDKGGKSWGAIILFLVIVTLFIWPLIYGKITKQDVTKDSNRYIKKIEKIVE